MVFDSRTGYPSFSLWATKEALNFDSFSANTQMITHQLDLLRREKEKNEKNSPGFLERCNRDNRRIRRSFRIRFIEKNRALMERIESRSNILRLRTRSTGKRGVRESCRSCRKRMVMAGLLVGTVAVGVNFHRLS